MKRGYGGDFYEDEKGILLGINLGSDFTSEHEHGINGIKNSFKITNDDDILGIEKRMIKICPEEIIYNNDYELNGKHYVLLLLLEPWSARHSFEIISNLLSHELRPIHSNSDLICAWDSKTFGILVSDRYKVELEALYTAFKNKDISIRIGALEYIQSEANISGFYYRPRLDNGGLEFLIVSKLPSEIIDSFYTNDLSNMNLQKEVKATGIHDILKKAGKEYHVLSPKWENENKKEIIFWLNPFHQDIYNFGWYTIKDLKEWANNKGKVIK